jgi:hypothetical protein
MDERTFTLEEANALIPKLELIMARLQQLTVRLRDEVTQLALKSGTPPERQAATGIVNAKPELDAALREVRKLIDDIGNCGGQLKGVDLGLVDFPADLNGQSVLLCWQFGEKEISYYHAPDAGFSSRKPLDPNFAPRRHLRNSG